MPPEYNSNPAEYYSSLGYNVDYQNGYNRSSFVLPTRQEFAQQMGWKLDKNGGLSDSQMNQYNEEMSRRTALRDEYFNWYDTNWKTWYDSEAQKKARLTAIGENPYYIDGLVSSGGDPRAGEYQQPHQFSETSAMLNTVNTIMNGITTAAQLADQFTSNAMDRDLTEQKVIAQALENRKSAHDLGLDDQLGFNSEYVGLNRRYARTFNRIRTDAGMSGEGGIYSDSPSRLNASPYARKQEASIIGTLASGENAAAGAAYKNYQTDNILPQLAALNRFKAAVEGASPEEAEELHKTIKPFVDDFYIGKYKYNPKSILDDWDNYIKEHPQTPDWIKNLGPLFLQGLAMYQSF